MVRRLGSYGSERGWGNGVGNDTASSAIAQKAAGHGLATAAVREVRELAAAQYGLTRLRAKVTTDNPASQTVLERNGFLAAGELTLNGKPAMSYICELC